MWAEEFAVFLDCGVVGGVPLVLVQVRAVAVAGADQRAQPTRVQGTARCHQRQQQADDPDQQHDDAYGVHVQVVQGAVRDGEPQDRPGRDQEEGQSGTHPASVGRRPPAGLAW